MDYDTHHLTSFVQDYLDNALPLSQQPPRHYDDTSDPRDLFINDNYKHIDAYDFGSDADTLIGISKDTTVALQPSLRRSHASNAKVRSMMYNFVYRSDKECVIDIGSGSFEKCVSNNLSLLNLYKGPDAILIEKMPLKFPKFSLEQMNDVYSVVHWQVDFNKKRDEVMQIKEKEKERVFVMCNSIMHLKQPPLEYDCIITFPHVQTMVDRGLAVRKTAQEYYMVEAEEIIEYEHNIRSDTIDDDIQHLSVVLQPRVIMLRKIRVTDAHIDQAALFDINRRPHRLVHLAPQALKGPFAKKLDGVTVLIVKLGRLLYVKTSTMLTVFRVLADYTGPFEDFELEGELLAGHVIVLHRVYSLGTIKIPHWMFSVTHEFVDKIKFDGLTFELVTKKLFDHLHTCLFTEETFGLTSPFEKVIKAEGVYSPSQDVAAKVVESIDVDADKFDMVRNYLEEKNITYETDTTFTPKQVEDKAIKEVMLIRTSDGNLFLRYARVRKDKFKSNELASIVKMINNIVSVDRHVLVDYLDDATLAKYKLLFKNLSSV